MKFKMKDLDTVVCMLKIREKADNAIDKTFEKSAPSLENQAKLNAPWRDRTGNARKTLCCICNNQKFSKKHIAVAGRMSYSPSLELCHGGRYSILFPTILKNARDILRDVVKAVEGVRV